MEIMHWIKRNGKRSRAIFYAERIVRGFKLSIRFLLTNGNTLTIKRIDIISITKEEE